MSWRNKSVRTRRGLWRLSSAVGVITPDDSGHGNHGTMVNAPTFARTPWGVSCMEFDGDDAHVNLGDLTYLNAAEKLTVAFWMNQDVLDVNEFMFSKVVGVGQRLMIVTHAAIAGAFEVHIDNNALSRYAYFDYSIVISAGSWHHIAVVFDGTQTGNANRLAAYVDGNPVTLTFSANGMPTATFDLSGVDATIGSSVSSFDGRLFDFQIHNVPLTRDEVGAVMRGHG